jgi:hypothetical protein
MKGDKSIEEQAKLQQKIIELQSEMKEKYDEYLMIKNQTKQMQEDIRLLKKYLLDINQEKLNEQRGVDDIDLHDKNSQLLIRKLNDEKDVRVLFSFFIEIGFCRFRICWLKNSSCVLKSNVLALYFIQKQIIL